VEAEVALFALQVAPWSWDQRRKKQLKQLDVTQTGKEEKEKSSQGNSWRFSKWSLEHPVQEEEEEEDHRIVVMVEVVVEEDRDDSLIAAMAPLLIQRLEEEIYSRPELERREELRS